MKTIMSKLEAIRFKQDMIAYGFQSSQWRAAPVKKP